MISLRQGIYVLTFLSLILFAVVLDVIQTQILFTEIPSYLIHSGVGISILFIILGFTLLYSSNSKTSDPDFESITIQEPIEPESNTSTENTEEDEVIEVGILEEFKEDE